MRFHSMRLLVTVACCCGLIGCATAERSLRTQPASYFSPSGMEITTGPLTGVKLQCIREREQAKNSQPNAKECLYFSADVTAIVNTHLSTPPTSPEVRLSLLGLLLSLSDYNCSNFLSRAFAVRSTFDGASKFVSDLTTGASAGTVTVAPGLSAGLDALNLLVGKSNQTFDSTFYFDKTFQAMESAIGADRAKRRSEISVRTKNADYSLMDVLSDARYYDDACSIRQGLQTLEALAKNQESESEAVKNLVEGLDSQEAKINVLLKSQGSAIGESLLKQYNELKVQPQSQRQ